MDNSILAHIFKKSIAYITNTCKKINGRKSLPFFYQLHIIAGLCGADRAGIGTGSAFDAFCRVDNVFSVAGFNGVYGTVFCAGSAFNTHIGNFVRHDDILLKIFY